MESIQAERAVWAKAQEYTGAFEEWHSQYGWRGIEVSGQSDLRSPGEEVQAVLMLNTQDLNFMVTVRGNPHGFHQGINMIMLVFCCF